MRQSDLLLVAATHGNEGFSIPVIEKLEAEIPGGFFWVIGNPRAHWEGVRFTEADLNRVAPGDPASPVYEVNRAAAMLGLIDQCGVTIDIHGTASDTGIFAIVSNSNPDKIALARSLWVPRVVFTQGTGSLMGASARGIGLECGSKSSPSVARELEQILRKFIANDFRRDTQMPQEWFSASGSIAQAESRRLGLRDFQLTEINGERFYPLFVWSDNPGYSCLKLQRIRRSR